MKTAVKFILQKILGFSTYLYVFALFVIVKIRWDKKENDFFHFMKLIPEGGLILDLGANIGVTADKIKMDDEPVVPPLRG